jgi:hypothetical protein
MNEMPPRTPAKFTDLALIKRKKKKEKETLPWSTNGVRFFLKSNATHHPLVLLLSSQI